MKNNNKFYDVKDFEFKLFTFLVTGTILLTVLKIYDKNKDNSQGEITIIKSCDVIAKDIPQKVLVNNISYGYKELMPQSSDYYRSIEVGGSIINFKNTPTPTPTPRYDLINAYTDDQILSEDGVKPEGFAEYEDRVKYKLNFDTTDEMISFYSKVFEVNEDISFKVVNGIIGDEGYPLKGEVVINDTTYGSLEEGISKIVRNLAYYPGDYGYTEDEVRSSEGYQLDYYEPEELIKKCAGVLDVDELIAAAIAYGECGTNLDSYLFRNYHNPGGIVSGNGFAKYRNEAAGIYEFVKLLHDKYYVRSDSDYNRIVIMSNGYCEDAEYWCNSLVGPLYLRLCNNGYTSIFYQRVHDRDFIDCEEEIKSYYTYTLKN